MKRYKAANVLQSAALFGAMAVILGLCGWIVAGGPGIVVLTGAGLALIALTPRVSPRMVLRAIGAERLSAETAPQLYAVLTELARRAGLRNVPVLCVAPPDMMTAFTISGRDRAYVILSAALLREMPARELTGVLSHEVAHIRNRDIWILSLADTVTRLTRTMSMFGLLLLLFNLPLVAVRGTGVSWTLILLLIFAPTIVALLQLALARTREFRADLEAAELSGDPEGLARALYRLEKGSHGIWERLFGAPRQDPVPSFLRTHPKTEERVRRLMTLPTGRLHPPIRLPSRIDAPRAPPPRLFLGPWGFGPRR